MARGGTGKQCANSLNGLAAATNHAANVSPSKLQLKDGRSAVRNFREDHVVRIFDPINLQRTIVTGFLWIVRADDLDKFPIARAPPVGHYHFVVGAILRSFSA